MSIEAIKWALNDAPDVPPQLVAVLIGLANHAGPDGKGAFASQARLARYARKSDRAVRNDLTSLLKLKLIKISENQGAAAHIRQDQRPVVYELALHRTGGSEVPGGSTVPAVNGDESGQGGSTGGSVLPGGSRVPGGSTASNDRKHTSDEPTTNQLPKDSSSPPAAPEDDTQRRSPKSKPKKPEPQRDDVDALCDRLVELMVANGCKPPGVGETWKTEARLLLDRDRRDLADALNVLEWSQYDQFWKANIHSIPTFREKYDKLRQRRDQDREARSNVVPIQRSGHRPYQNPADQSVYLQGIS